MTFDLFATPRSLAIEAVHEATGIYTKTKIVDQLLDQLDWPRASRRLVDPSCGDGAFLLQAIARLLAASPAITTHDLADQIHGWEFHDQAANQARRNISALLIDHGWGRALADDAAEKIVHHADFLTDGPNEPLYDVIAGNPPYLKWSNVPEILRLDYREIVPVFAQPDLLFSFIERVSRCLRTEGEAALVISDRFLFNESAAALRAALGRRGFGIHTMERLDPTSAFYRAKHRIAGTPPRIHPVALVLRRLADPALRLSETPVFPEDQKGQWNTGHTLGDIAQVQIAPWLGTPGIFVIDAATARTLPPEHLIPAIDTDDLDGDTLKTPTRFAIRTHPDVTPPPEIMRHLEHHMPRMASRGRPEKTPNTTANPTPLWLPPERFHKWDFSQPRLLIPRIAKSLRVIEIPPGYLPINHNISVVSAGCLPLDQIAAILRSDLSQAWFATQTPAIDNGYRSLMTRPLRALPIQLDQDGPTSI